MESYPPIPAGRNYIQLVQASDALAFIEYMALQAYRTILLVPDQLATTFSELLKSLTRTNVHRITTVHEFQHISTAFRDILVTDSYDVLVISSDLLNFVSLHDLYSDCVLHWGQPPNANLFISRAIVFLPLTATVCIIVGKQDFNGLAYAVAPYPELVLAACVNPQSPFHLLRQLSSQLLFGYDQRVQMELWKFISNTPTNPIAPKPLMPPAPSVSYQQAPSVLSLPPGHYYILLDTAKEIDIIPVVVLLAMNTRKVMCRITTRKDLYHYRRLMRGFDLNIIIPKLAKYPAVKAAMDELKSDQRGILLRNEYKDWNIHFSRSLVNCLIFCGIPPDGVKKYYTECREKVTHSYLILTNAEYYKIPFQQTLGRHITSHPTIKASEFTRPGSQLYDLRQQLINVCRN
ncbi:unnamed protein product [Rhizoctonia solani]|uniref:Uncharacterized protein n=1 Tax=Rhizoctonia solani TaxID=456999 RepID=A0A8H3C9H7_9AGAM|nr:unnamed protein product [Rhizoctonia solani]